MSRLFYHVMQDNAGNLLFDVSGTMRLAGTGTAATIYGDEALTVPIANPMTNHPSFGSFKCFLGVGDYDFYMAKSGYTFETLTGVQGSGTMADQNASAVAITGGTADLTTLTVSGLSGLGKAVNAAYSVSTPTLEVTGTALVSTKLVLGGPVTGGARSSVQYSTSTYGMILQPNFTGTANPILFRNEVETAVGGIVTNATTTAYNTTSDSRLKKDVQPLTGALDVVRELRPVRFQWNSDESVGHGFVASEVEDVVPGVITGTRDAVDAEGNVLPQQIDHSKLVVWLVAAVKELTAQVEILTARCDAAGT